MNKNIYKEKGYKSREDYLLSLAEKYGTEYDLVVDLANLLGPNEDFDGLLNALDDCDVFDLFDWDI